jgi:hypothetical protein
MKRRAVLLPLLLGLATSALAQDTFSFHGTAKVRSRPGESPTVYLFTGQNAVDFWSCVHSSSDSAIRAGARCALSTNNNRTIALDVWYKYNATERLDNTSLDGYQCLGMLVAVSSELNSDFTAITREKVAAGEIDLTVP